MGPPAEPEVTRPAVGGTDAAPPDTGIAAAVREFGALGCSGDPARPSHAALSMGWSAARQRRVPADNLTRIRAGEGIQAAASRAEAGA